MKNFVGVFASVSLATVIVGCGAAQSQFIKNFSVGFQNSNVQVTAEFSRSVPLNTELEVPVKNLGTLKLIPATDDKGFQIQTTLNTSAWLDIDLLKNKVNSLPNGTAFPAFVSTDLALKNISKSNQISTNLYLGTSLQKKYLGAGVELNFLGSKFPSSISLTQKIIDSNNKEIGAVTLYGPKVEGGVVKAPGGVFFVTDIGMLRPAGQFAYSSPTKRIPLLPYDGVDVSANMDSVAREFKKQSKLLSLFNLFHSEGREAGLID
jgi:hypothetical protein